MTGIELYAALRRARVPHHKAIALAEMTETELGRHLRGDLPLTLELMTLWGSRRRQTNAELIFLIAAKVLGPRQRAHLAELVEHWKRP